jgi:L,D-transpeptidase catalytic domain
MLILRYVKRSASRFRHRRDSLRPGRTSVGESGIFRDLSRQRMTVKKPGGEALVWKVLSGRPGFETLTAVFNVQRMDAEHFSDEYDQAPMPYAIFFSRGLAIHGSNERSRTPGVAWMRPPLRPKRPRSLFLGGAAWRDDRDCRKRGRNGCARRRALRSPTPSQKTRGVYCLAAMNSS